MQIGKITNIKSFIIPDKWQFFRATEPFKSSLAKAMHFISCLHTGNKEYDIYGYASFLLHNQLSPVHLLGESTPLFYLMTNNGFKNFKILIDKG